MNDSSDTKRQNMHHMPMSCDSPLENRLSSMPPEELEHQNMSYLGKHNLILNQCFKDILKNIIVFVFSQWRRLYSGHS